MDSSQGRKLEAGMEDGPQEVSRKQDSSCRVPGSQNRCVEPLFLGHKPGVCQSPLEESMEMLSMLPQIPCADWQLRAGIGGRVWCGVVWWEKAAKPGITVTVKKYTPNPHIRNSP